MIILQYCWYLRQNIYINFLLIFPYGSGSYWFWPHLWGLVARMGFIYCKHDLMLFIHGRELHSKHTDANSFTFSLKIPPHDATEVIKAPSNAQMCPSIRRLSYLTHLDGFDSISSARKFCTAISSVGLPEGSQVIIKL